MSYPSPAAIQADFDRIALLSEEQGWNHNEHYHSFLFRYVPRNCREALEIGCGTGDFSHYLARCSDHVLALDLSPQMIRIARERSPQYPNIDFQVADALEWEFPHEHYDCIVSIATLHHLPLRIMLEKLRKALKPGGMLIILDLRRSEGVADRVGDLAAILTGFLFRLIKRRLIVPRSVRAAWDEHGKHDTYLSVREVKELCAGILPGARVKWHLLWRYSIIYEKSR